MANSEANDYKCIYFYWCIPLFGGASVVQWVKRWPTDLAAAGSSPSCGRDLFNCKGGSITHSLSLSTSHHPDMTERLLKRKKIPHLEKACFEIFFPDNGNPEFI